MGNSLAGGLVLGNANGANLVSTWNTIWSALQTFSFLTKILVLLGTILVVAALVRMIWAKVRNRPIDSKPMIWAIIVGTFLMFPNEIIKLILGIVDSAIGMFKQLFTTIFK